jgi:hypothetical protein
MKGPCIVAGGEPEDGFRIVWIPSTDFQDGHHVVELEGKPDALGVERWEEVRSDSKVVKALRDYIIRHAEKVEQHAAD